jgi:diguanylate cyclase (GGDEF)-like protein
MVLRKNKYQVPEEYDELFLSEKNAFNLRHLNNVTLIIILIAAILLLQYIFFPQSETADYNHIYKMIFSLIILESLIFYLISKFIRKEISDKSKKVFLFVYIYCLSFLFMGLTYFDLHFGQELSGFIIVLMFLSTMIWFSPKEFAFISTFVLFLLIISYLILSSFITIQFQQIVQGLIFYSISWVMYLSISSVRIESFLNRITMEKQYEMLETESATDPLTGLYNRRYLKEEIKKELSRSERSGLMFCILLLDIDHFKKINDNYGHITGDEVLKELSAILRNSVRLSDKVFRFGGEEFIVLLPETLAVDSKILGERIREKIENFSFSGVRKKITVSGGITQSSIESSLELLIQKADKRLYFAKENGRNLIICGDENSSVDV